MSFHACHTIPNNHDTWKVKRKNTHTHTQREREREERRERERRERERRRYVSNTKVEEEKKRKFLIKKKTKVLTFFVVESLRKTCSTTCVQYRSVFWKSHHRQTKIINTCRGRNKNKNTRCVKNGKKEKKRRCKKDTLTYKLQQGSRARFELSFCPNDPPMELVKLSQPPA